MKVAFCTCVQLGLSCIEEIYQIGGKLDLLISLRDDMAVEKSGRIYLDDIAGKKHIPLLKISDINQVDLADELHRREIDWLFIIGWSQIAGQRILKAPKKGCIGIHPTLLPQGRGRAAIPWTILKELDRTGITMFKLDEGVDTGDIIGQLAIDIDEDITAAELYDRLNRMHAEIIRTYWKDIVSNRVRLKVQDHSSATEWMERRPSDGQIFSSMTMKEAERMVRAVTHPYPGAFYIENNVKMTIWSAVISPKDGLISLADGYLTPIEYEVTVIC